MLKNMLREGYSFILEAPWLSLAAGGAIFLIALASQMVADPLQGILARGPELRGRPASARPGVGAVLRGLLSPRTSPKRSGEAWKRPPPRTRRTSSNRLTA